MYKVLRYSHFNLKAGLLLTALLSCALSTMAASDTSLYITPNTVISNADKIVVTDNQNKTSTSTINVHNLKHVFIKPKTVIHNLHLIKEQVLKADELTTLINTTGKTIKPKPKKNKKSEEVKIHKHVFKPIKRNAPYTLLFKKSSCCITLSPKKLKLDGLLVAVDYTINHNLNELSQLFNFQRPHLAPQQLQALYSFSLPPPQYYIA